MSSRARTFESYEEALRWWESAQARVRSRVARGLPPVVGVCEQPAGALVPRWKYVHHLKRRAVVLTDASAVAGVRVLAYDVYSPSGYFWATPESLRPAWWNRYTEGGPKGS